VEAASPTAFVAWGSSAPITAAGEAQAVRKARTGDNRFGSHFIFLFAFFQLRQAQRSCGLGFEVFPAYRLCIHQAEKGEASLHA
jgi:hypothetical protein